MTISRTGTQMEIEGRGIDGFLRSPGSVSTGTVWWTEASVPIMQPWTVSSSVF